jgi:predicted PurR-regulated permease PerM
MLAIGLVTAVVLVTLRVPGALPLAILAGLLEFVPTVGPILSAVPSVAMAFVDSPEKAAVVGVAYFGIQFLENHLLIPLLMKEGVDLPPVLTILMQATMAIAFGIMGLFVAVPVLVVVTILVKMLYVEDVIGDRTALPFTQEKPPVARPATPR